MNKERYKYAEMVKDKDNGRITYAYDYYLMETGKTVFTVTTYGDGMLSDICGGLDKHNLRFEGNATINKKFKSVIIEVETFYLPEDSFSMALSIRFVGKKRMWYKIYTLFGGKNGI